MTLPQYYKTVAEFTAPLEDPAKPVHQAGLRLEHIETRVRDNPKGHGMDYVHAFMTISKLQ